MNLTCVIIFLRVTSVSLRSENLVNDITIGVIALSPYLAVTIIIKAGHKWKCLKRSEIVSYVVTDIASERVCHSSSFFLSPFIRNTLINDWNTIMKNNT